MKRKLLTIVVPILIGLAGLSLIGSKSIDKKSECLMCAWSIETGICADEGAACLIDNDPERPGHCFDNFNTEICHCE